MNNEKQYGVPPPGYPGRPRPCAYRHEPPQGYPGQPGPGAYPHGNVYHGEGQAGPGVYPTVPPPYETYPQPQPQPMPPPQVQVVQAPVVITPVGPDPSRTVCPSCRAQIVTRVNHNSSTKTHVIALILCVIGCWPCCLIPYCCNSCQDAEHYCPNCNAFIGTYSMYNRNNTIIVL